MTTDFECTVDALRARVRELMPAIRADLEALVRIPSCAFEGFPREPVRAGAAETSRVLAVAVDEVSLLDVPGGEPAVLGRISGPDGAPRVLLYAHYDVQPAGDETAWHTPPFDPVEVGGRLYGRGAADDKSGIVVHAGALRAVRDVLGEVALHVTVIVEGEEECGGPLPDLVLAQPDLLAADAIVVADVGNLRIGEPTLTTALRGLVDCIVEVRTLPGPLHSGMYGGPAPDALLALIRILDTLRTPDGDTAVDVPGSDWPGADYPEDLYRELTGATGPLLGGGSIASRLYSRPAVNVIGLDAPRVEGAINAVIPVARAKVSLRIPPGVDPAVAMDRLITHLRAAAPWEVEVTVTPGQGAPGESIGRQGPAYAAAQAAMASAYGRPAGQIGSGGSIPLVAALAQTQPTAEILLFGAQDPGARIHAPNESVDLAELERAVLAEAIFLARLAVGAGVDVG